VAPRGGDRGQRLRLSRQRPVAGRRLQQLLAPRQGVGERAVEEQRVAAGDVQRRDHRRRPPPPPREREHGGGLLAGSPVEGLQGVRVVVFVAGRPGQRHRLRVVPEPAGGEDHPGRDGLEAVAQQRQAGPGQVPGAAQERQAPLDQPLAHLRRRAAVPELADGGGEELGAGGGLGPGLRQGVQGPHDAPLGVGQQQRVPLGEREPAPHQRAGRGIA
jgi:hypothetical protein